MSGELRPIEPGRYGVTLMMPWGQEVPAEMIMATRDGWSRRPEAQDPRWSAYPLGPVVLAIRLLAPPAQAPDPPKPSPPSPPPRHRGRTAPVRLPRSPVPGEWN